MCPGGPGVVVIESSNNPASYLGEVDCFDYVPISAHKLDFRESKVSSKIDIQLHVAVSLHLCNPLFRRVLRTNVPPSPRAIRPSGGECHDTNGRVHVISAA
jgi:hypothetical protein